VILRLSTSPFTGSSGKIMADRGEEERKMRG
jgi:hypothetical protein